MSSTNDDDSEIASLLDSFTRQKQVLTNIQMDIQRLDMELKLKDDAYQNASKRNQKLSFANDDLLEKIEIYQETQTSLEKELHELVSSKTNMQMTLKAMDSKIEEIRDSQAQELEEVTNMISKSKSTQLENEKLFTEMLNTGIITYFLESRKKFEGIAEEKREN